MTMRSVRRAVHVVRTRFRCAEKPWVRGRLAKEFSSSTGQLPSRGPSQLPRCGREPRAWATGSREVSAAGPKKSAPRLLRLLGRLQPVLAKERRTRSRARHRAPRGGPDLPASGSSSGPSVERQLALPLFFEAALARPKCAPTSQDRSRHPGCAALPAHCGACPSRIGSLPSSESACSAVPR